MHKPEPVKIGYRRRIDAEVSRSPQPAKHASQADDKQEASGQ
jgi:hypothetical protein